MQNKSEKNKKDTRRCSYCGAAAPVIWVHGHGQCAACGINVAECCQGEQCDGQIKDLRTNKPAPNEFRLDPN